MTQFLVLNVVALIAVVGVGLKGKLFTALGGLIGLLAPPVGFIVLIVGMCRLAHPGSWWARHFYGPAQLQNARLRFDSPLAGTEPVPEPKPWPRPRDES